MVDISLGSSSICPMNMDLRPVGPRAALLNKELIPLFFTNELLIFFVVDIKDFNLLRQIHLVLINFLYF
jgi:hypothetical protein